MQDWFESSAVDVGAVLLSVAVLYSGVVLLTRLFGLRSFSKMSAGDFAMTVAVGSLLGSSVSNPSPTIVIALVALAGLFCGQWLFARLRTSSIPFSAALENQPLMLVWNGELCPENMRQAGVADADIRAKLREANVFALRDAAAVVFETTGDVSVLHGRPVGDFDDFVLGNVRRDASPGHR